MRFFQRKSSGDSDSPVLPAERTVTSGAVESGAAGATETSRLLDGVRIHYATWGAPAPARATLLIHGLTASHMAWMALGPALAADGAYVIAPDLRGRGLSDKPQHGYSVVIHAAELLALADALGLASFQVVGHSLGAVIGMSLAVMASERVSKLVMVDAGGQIPEDTAQAIGASVARLGASYPSLDAYLATMRQLPMFTWNDTWEAYFRYDAEERPDGTVVSRVPKAAIEEESLALALTRSEALPALVRAPTLVVRAPVGLLGPDRGLILPREEAERLKQVMPNCEVIEIDGTNHYTVVLSPVFVEAVQRFLRPESANSSR
ncbi:MAG TPA: alpha/beta hydrolase [Ktedonobacterales bacterium]|nr:alpha/beta hydrolase [Ktedonobacterales bacterium]